MRLVVLTHLLGRPSINVQPKWSGSTGSFPANRGVNAVYRGTMFDFLALRSIHAGCTHRIAITHDHFESKSWQGTNAIRNGYVSRDMTRAIMRKLEEGRLALSSQTIVLRASVEI